MAWTTPKTWSDGAALTAAELNEQLRDNAQWIHDVLTIYNIQSSAGARTIKPALGGVRVYRGSDQNISDSTFTNISFGTEKFDTRNAVSSTYHSTSVNTDRLTVPSGAAGYYVVGANASFASNATGTRRMRIQHSSDGVIAADSRAPATGILTQMTCTTLWYFAVGDYAYVEVFQSSTGTLAIDGTTNTYLPAFWMYQVAV